MKTNQNNSVDITLIGAGIMSATLGVLLKKLIPDAQISIYEQLDKIAGESTDSWNNAGTGHSAFCEMNYTPEQPDGSVNIDKALEIASDFEISRQFWAYLKAQNHLKNYPFITKVPHMSFVWGDENVLYLKKRYEALIQNVLFEDMKFSEDYDEIASWAPIMMANRNRNERIAATWMEVGTDVNFDVLAKGMINYLKSCNGVNVYLRHKVKDLVKQKDGSWKIIIKNLNTDKAFIESTNFVFIGAGGGSFPLLQKSGIIEAKGYGGFPVSGMFLRCTNKDVVKLHNAKVYGKIVEGSPPMSMPHLDKRFIDGEECLLFGPYAGITTKFLKKGSYWDLPLSFRLHNILPMLAAGWHNLSLIKYLIVQALQSKKSRFKLLKMYFPDSKMEDWELYVAGLRVQIMKNDKKEGGVLKLGTEIINSSDGTLSALLGASPGASTSVSTMLEVLNRCFAEKMATQEWKDKLSEMIPSFGKSLIINSELSRSTRKDTEKNLYQ